MNTALTTAAATIFVALLSGPPLLLRLSRKNRLRTRITADLAIIEKMPPSSGKDCLVAQVEHDTLRLVAWEEPHTEDERSRLFVGSVFVGVGLLCNLSVLLVYVVAPPNGRFPQVLAGWNVIFFAMCVTCGLGLMFRPKLYRERRVQRLLRRADEAHESPTPAPEARSDTPVAAAG